MPRCPSFVLSVLRACVAITLGWCCAARAEAGAPTLDPALVAQLEQFGVAHGPPAGRRVEVQVGALDPRLRLAPCARVEPFLPAGARLWGRSRVGLRCVDGSQRWSVFVPVTVRVYGTAVVARTALPAGAPLAAEDLAQAEVDLAEEPSVALADAAAAVGRTLARPLAAGQAVRAGHLRARQWFAAGDTVSVRAAGSGFSVAGTAQALTPGIEGQAARVRTESGRVLTGEPAGERRIEVPL